MKFNKEQLIEQIRAIGQGLIDNASSMVTDVENMSNIDISISFTLDSVPSVSFSTDFYPNTLLDDFKNKDYQVLFVTGNSYYEKVKNIRVPENVIIKPFIYELPSLMKSADLMVTRAGASTMSEILVLNIPAIFIPSPYVTNNHQYKNAMDLVEKQAGLILEEKDLTKDNLINLIDKTLSNKEQYNKIKNNLKELGIKDSSTRIYEVLKEMIIDDKKFF